MISKLFVKLCEIPWARKILWKSWYQFLAGKFPVENWTFMNYGYQPLDPNAPKLELSEADESDRYCIQLYHHVAMTAGTIEGKDVLEVGSGRGGGASYVCRYLKPNRIVGADFSKHAVDLANKRLGGGALSYVEGDAGNLPFEDASFDVVLNVESSHCYPSRPLFFAQVFRVLRPGGVLSIVDIFLDHELEETRKQLEESGLKIESAEDVSKNVLEGLKRDGARREAEIASHAPKSLAPVVKSFAGTEGSDVYNSIANGRLKYVLFKAVKPA